MVKHRTDGSLTDHTSSGLLERVVGGCVGVGNSSLVELINTVSRARVIFSNRSENWKLWYEVTIAALYPLGSTSRGEVELSADIHTVYCVGCSPSEPLTVEVSRSWSFMRTCGVSDSRLCIDSCARAPSPSPMLSARTPSSTCPCAPEGDMSQVPQYVMGMDSPV